MVDKNVWVDRYSTYGSTDMEVIRRTGCNEMLDQYAIVKFDQLKNEEDYTEDELITIQYFIQLTRSFLAVTDAPLLPYSRFYGRPLFANYDKLRLPSNSFADKSCMSFLSSISYKRDGGVIEMYYNDDLVRKTNVISERATLISDNLNTNVRNVQFEESMKLLRDTCVEFPLGPIKETSIGVVHCIEDTCPLSADSRLREEALIYQRRLHILYLSAERLVTCPLEFRMIEKIMRNREGWKKKKKGGYIEHLEFKGHHYKDKANSARAEKSGLFSALSDLAFTKADYLRIKEGRKIRHTGVQVVYLDEDLERIKKLLKGCPIPKKAMKSFMNYKYDKRTLMIPEKKDHLFEKNHFFSPTPTASVSC